MSELNPIDLLFGGMEKLGPGSDDDTLKVLDMLPSVVHEVIVDAGSGAGRQILALARRLQALVHAVDSYEPFLVSLAQRARGAGIAQLVQTHCMDMADISNRFREIDLLGSEGAAYKIGFPRALEVWHSAVKVGGFAVVSELSWLRDEVSVEVRRFFRASYPGMRSLDENRLLASGAGNHVLGTHALPRQTWVQGY